MGKALYRKYRSKRLSEVVGQDHIISSLSNALKNDKINHAYLFTGPRGVGKTSVARILAHEINSLPYDDDTNHIDIIEIDAASNRRIDEIRELRERVHVSPTSAKYKVYIIDEVHMLTKEAFNALLKTLEEPPAHVVFILATTEAQKLPDTIISRTQRFNFKPIDNKIAVEHLKAIARKEKVKIDQDALETITEHSSGSFRDSISLMDQLTSGASEVTARDVLQNLGLAPGEVIVKFVNTLTSGSPKDAIELLDELKEKGFSPSQISKQLAGSLRNAILEGNLPLKPTVLAQALEDLLAVGNAREPGLALEITIIKIVLSRQSDENVEQVDVTTDNQKSIKPNENPKIDLDNLVVGRLEDQLPPDELIEDIQPPDDPFDHDKLWAGVLNSLKSKHNTLYGIARMAQPVMTDNTLTLTFSFPFHLKRLNEDRNKLIIEDIILKLSGNKVIIVCALGKQDKKTSSSKNSVEVKPLPNVSEAISNIFGGAEVLE